MKSSNLACCWRKLAPAGFCGLEIQGQMHAFMAAVLLRATWLDALDLDAEPEPPDRQPAQAEEGIGACERDAVIGANGLGQAELLEHGLEHWERVGFLGGRERLASEQVSAGEVGDRQRIAIATIGEHELAFVVGAPQVVGLAGTRKRRSLRPVPPSHSAFD